MRDRYYTVETEGYTITAKGASTTPGISVSVLDRFIIHREVDRYTSTTGANTPNLARARARARCAELNALERGYEKAGLA